MYEDQEFKYLGAKLFWEGFPTNVEVRPRVLRHRNQSVSKDPMLNGIQFFQLQDCLTVEFSQSQTTTSRWSGDNLPGGYRIRSRSIAPNRSS